MAVISTRRGGDWLVAETEPAEVFTPEKLSDEQRLIAKTAAEFLEKEVDPALPELEAKNWTVARKLIARAGELGLLGTDVPESVGGIGLDKVTALVVGEAIGSNAAFATTFGAQTGLSIVPILCFGTPEQQQKYLRRLVTGEIIGAYCMSESGAGSDALGARAKATRLADGSWSITGEKMWITNGGFADIFIVFAKVDGEQFSAFIVERAFPGVSTGKEEHKMGLRGSSTTPLVLQDARVPAENLLGEIGRGHKIAFNVLNYGRFKLASMCTGGAKVTIEETVKYALGRRQFGQPIASFGAIRHKLAEMTIRTFAAESMLFRTAGLLDAAIGPAHEPAAVLAALEEFAIEASLLKVGGSEMIDFVVDESVQIHGGNGFVTDYPAERRYRDARINRIFEGTNEINRLLVPGMLVKRALKGGIPLVEAAKAVRDEILTGPGGYNQVQPGTTGTTGTTGTRAFKKASLMAVGLAMQTYGEGLQHEQEVLMLLSDILLDTFAAESAELRAAQAAASGHPTAALQAGAARVFTYDAGLRIETRARTLISAMLTGDAERTALAGLKRVLKFAAVNTVAERRTIADAIAGRKGYVF